MTQFHRLGSVAQRGFWWARDYLDAGIAVGRSYLSRTPASSFEVGRDDLPIVVILPGVYEPWRFQLPLIRGLHARGYRVRVVEDLRDNRVAVRTGATIAQKVVDRVAAGPGSVVLVAHSKGGLIGKRLLLDAGEDSPLIGLVAVATPFAGSVLARLTPGRTLSELRPTSQTIQGLADEAANAKIVSVLPAFDPHVPGERLLPGATVRTLKGAGHFSVLTTTELLEAVIEGIELLRTPGPASDSPKEIRESPDSSP